MTRCWKCGHDESTAHFNGENCPTDGVVSVHEFLCRDECEHGSLRRACEICERDEEIASLKKQLEDRECCGNCKHYYTRWCDGSEGYCKYWNFDEKTREERK